MRFVRYQETGDPAVRYGWIYGDLVGEIEGDIFGEFRRLEANLPLYTVRLLPPVVPGKIVAVEWNYLDQTREFNRMISEMPSLFLQTDQLGHRHERSDRSADRFQTGRTGV